MPPIFNFLLEFIFHNGERIQSGSIIHSKTMLALPHHFRFRVVDVQEAVPDTELQEALSLTGWLVIPWTLSAILKCVPKLVLCESWAPENGERGIGKT